MLPGLRFLFAATLISASLLVFGMGAIALMRASHQQFASLPPRQPPEPVFAQTPQTVPSLSMLRAEPVAATPPSVVPEPERAASLTNAERAVEPALPPPAIADPKLPEPSTDTRSDAAPPADPPPMPQVMPLAENPPTADAPAVSVADAPAVPEKLPERAAVAVAPETIPPETIPPSPTPQYAAAPDAAAPDITGSVMPPDPPSVAAKPVLDPPLPLARPEIAALPPAAASVPARAAPKVVVKRKLRQAAKPKPRARSEKLPATSSAPTLGSLFGASSN